MSVSELLSHFVFFTNRKLNGSLSSQMKSNLVIKCLTSTKSFEERDVPLYGCSIAGPGHPPPLFIRFRILVIRRYMTFVAQSPGLDQYVGFSETAPALIERLLSETDARLASVDIQWAYLLPKAIGCPRNKVIKRLFQVTKQYNTVTASVNLKSQLVGGLMQSFTVDDPLALTSAVIPEMRPFIDAVMLGDGKKPIKALEQRLGAEVTRENAAVLYQILNRHLNWISFNFHQIVNPGLPLVEAPEETAYTSDMRCSVCLRLLTFRSLKRKGNPRNVEPLYNCDTHSFDSSCCWGRILKVPLFVGKTPFAIYTVGKQSYCLCRCGCGKVIFSESAVQAEALHCTK